MGIWKAKVFPKLQKFFGVEHSAKKTAAAEACKSFDESKEEVCKEFEEKKEELKPKVIEIYEASSTEIKGLVKEPKRPGLKKHSDAVQKFVEELVKIEFPGSKPVCDATTQYGAALVPGPIIFIFEKVSTLVVTTETEEEVKPREVEPPAATATTTTVEETSVAETDKKEDVVVMEKSTTDAPVGPEKEVAPAAAEPAEKDAASAK